jgi:hypothetical protein
MVMSDEQPRNRQVNIKASDDCRKVFLALVKFYGTKQNDLFEHFVAMAQEEVLALGQKLDLGNGE